MQHLEIPVACVQARARSRDEFAAAWPRIVRLAREAARDGARLIVLPEATVPGYVLGTAAVAPEELALAARDLADVAREHAATIVYGTAKIVDGRTFNAAVAIGPDGRELGFAAKAFLWHFDRRWFAAGDAFEPVDTPLGRIGLLVCADGRIPSIAATLVDRGARMLVMPTAWVTSGRDPHALENVQADLMVRVRARENGVPFIAANKVGVECASVAYCGKSSIVDGDGAIVGRGSETDEEIVTATVVPGAGLARHAFAGAVPSATSGRDRARIAYTLERDAAALARLRAYASDADADILLAPGATSGPAPGDGAALMRLAGGDGTCDAAGITVATLAGATLASPRALVDLRLAGVDLFAWFAHGTDPAWHVAFARTRAAELRAYVVVFAEDRAFAVDPDGAVVSGTFGEFRLAAFAYDRARAAATTVAPTTDVAAGLRRAEAIRALATRARARA